MVARPNSSWIDCWINTQTKLAEKLPLFTLTNYDKPSIGSRYTDKTLFSVLAVAAILYPLS